MHSFQQVVGGRNRRAIALTVVSATLSLAVALWVEGIASLCGDPFAVLFGERSLGPLGRPAVAPRPAAASEPKLESTGIGSEKPARDRSAALASDHAEEAPRAMKPASGAQSVEPTQGAETIAPRCPRELRLLASVVNATHPDRSFAAVRKDRGTYLLGIGQRLGDLELIALRPARAYLKPGIGPVCRLPVFLPSGERAPPSAPSPAPGRGKEKQTGAAFSKAELAAGVRALGRGQFAISRELLARAFADKAALQRLVTLRVRNENGRMLGVELAAIPAGSPFEQLGLRPGDLISSLNGHDLRNPAAAMQAFRELKTADRVKLQLQRNGSFRTLAYFAE